MTFPTQQAIFASLYSWYLSLYPIIVMYVGTGYALGTKGGFTDFPSFEVYVSNTWFMLLIGLVFQVGPYQRAKQAYTAAKSGMVLPPPEQNQPPSPPKGP